MDVPIACTLTAAEMTDRRSLWQRIETDAVRRRRFDDRFEIVYAPTSEVERVLPSLVDAESHCCAFAQWRIVRNPEEVVLTVSGPPEGLAALCSEFGIE